jgi:hypothetical protein
MKIQLLLLLCLPLLVFSAEKKIVEGIDENSCTYNLSACAIFQNESPFLKEWIEYHRIVGVEHFYLYNNNSTDDYSAVLAPYVQQGIVELFDWSSPPQVDWTPYQQQAYNDCVQRSIGHTRWLAVIDIDEFIVPVRAPNIQALLKKFDTKEIGGLMCFWQMFGTSNCHKLDPTKPMIEQLILKAPVNHPWNHQVKSICKPHIVARYAVHGAHYKRGYYDVTTKHKSGPQQIVIDEIRIHHYWTRDEDFCFNVKIPRRERCEGRPYRIDQMEALIRDFNQVEDTTIHRFLPALKSSLF